MLAACLTLVGCASTTDGAPVGQAPASTHSAPSPDPCAGNGHPQYIRVSISQQHAWLCEHDQLAYDTAVTTGMTGSKDTRTPIGTFRIEGRNRDTTLTPGTGEAYPVKYWIPFDAPSFGFHDASWQHFRFGSDRYRTQGSHGCVHLPLPAVEFLYEWVRVGATVRITA